MIGLVVVGYDVLPEAMLVAMQHKCGKQAQVVAVALALGEEIEDQRAVIFKAIERVDSGDGVLMFTDGLDTTAGHLSLSILNKVDINVITSVNLTMLYKVVENREHMSGEELAKLARDEGRKGIALRSP